ncbi:hypothetical protein KUTeg_000195 [Tegillarca granosa]|uniref:Uncharacterized protein n=1 Tax=Tegillarca granosa TaxID=220873 RepID=A0ABQ9FWV4_TEGGR|nr:hypothetical protein KUTeg_000195 [Tegillarca granosa]
MLDWIKKGGKQTCSKDDWLNGWWKREVIKSQTPESGLIQQLHPSKHSSIGCKPKLPTSKSAVVQPTEKPIMQPVKTSISSSLGSIMTSPAKKLDYPAKTSIKERATNLLARGCMPLFSTARREWDQEESVQLLLSLNWPPVGWKEMVADCKFLAWEFASMTIENSKCSDSINCQQSRRSS